MSLSSLLPSPSSPPAPRPGPAVLPNAANGANHHHRHQQQYPRQQHRKPPPSQDAAMPASQPTTLHRRSNSTQRGEPTAIPAATPTAPSISTSPSPAATATATATAPRINTVSYRNATIKAQIDITMVVTDVIRQLCANAHLGVQEPPALFALRDEENDDLIDDSNLAKKIEAGRNFKLTASPLIEAAEMVDKLCSREERTLKMATYTLQRLIREPSFTAEFLRRGGLQELLVIVHTFSSGNTLAYALASCQNLLESCDQGLESLDSTFVARVVQILVTQERINVCRPATAILKKLVLSGTSSLPGTDAGGTSLSSKFGFQVVYEQICKEPSFLPTLVHRLSSADATLCVYSLSLLNSLMRCVTDPLFDAFTSELERLRTSSAVARLMDTSCGEDLSASILEYQTNIIRVYHHRLRMPVTPTEKRHVAALTNIWRQARISEEAVATSPSTDGPPNGQSGAVTKYKWRRLGFSDENVAKDFVGTGWLGLECCETYARSDPEAFSHLILEQLNRAEEKRCPWGRASIEVVDILANHWGIASGYTTATQFMPFLLFFSRVHHLALRFFLRMWTESGATAADFNRVSALVRSQVRCTLQDEAAKSWSEVEKSFLESEYRVVRDRQMQELELEDDFENRPSIRALRAKLYRESWEFVRHQRIQCLLEGAWFQVAGSTRFGGGRKTGNNGTGGLGSPSISHGRKTGTAISATAPPVKAWRFYRLNPNKRLLHYCESSEPHPIRSGLEDFSERIDLAQVTDLALQSCLTVLSSTGGEVPLSVGPATAGSVDRTRNPTSNYSFSLLRAADDSLADLVASSSSQYSEWVDGLSMLRGEGSVVNTEETADFIQALTDIAVKVKLLDLTGEKVDIPATIPQPELPNSLDFFFAEL